MSLKAGARAAMEKLEKYYRLPGCTPVYSIATALYPRARLNGLSTRSWNTNQISREQRYVEDEWSLFRPLADF